MTGLTVKLWPTVQLGTLQLEPAAGRKYSSPLLSNVVAASYKTLEI